MRDPSLLGPWIRRFLMEHMVSERNLARNTQRSYRDALRLLLPAIARRARKSVDRLAVTDVSADRVRQFLNELEEKRMKMKYVYVLAGAYSIAALLYILMLFVETGHEANPCDFIFYLSTPACRFLDLFPDLIRTKSALPQILSCLLAGLFQFALIGCIVDLIVSRSGKR